MNRIYLGHVVPTISYARSIARNHCPVSTQCCTNADAEGDAMTIISYVDLPRKRVLEINNRHTTALLLRDIIRDLPEGCWTCRAVAVEVPGPRQQSSPSKTKGFQRGGKETYLSNQLPKIPLADLIPPTCIPSERHRSSPWKMEKVVQRISPSGVCRTVPSQLRLARPSHIGQN